MVLTGELTLIVYYLATEDGGGILDDPLKARLLQQKLSSLIRRKPSPTEAKRRNVFPSTLTLYIIDAV